MVPKRTAERVGQGRGRGLPYASDQRLCGRGRAGGHGKVTSESWTVRPHMVGRTGHPGPDRAGRSGHYGALAGRICSRFATAGGTANVPMHTGRGCVKRQESGIHHMGITGHGGAERGEIVGGAREAAGRGGFGGLRKEGGVMRAPHFQNAGGCPVPQRKDRTKRGRAKVSWVGVSPLSQRGHGIAVLSQAS